MPKGIKIGNVGVLQTVLLSLIFTAHTEQNYVI